MITNIEDYFVKGCGRCDRFDTTDCATHIWRQGVQSLRNICLGEGLTETVKWGHPCYMHAKRNIAIIGAFRKDFRLSFFNARLMQDPQNALERQGANTSHPDMLRFNDNAGPAAKTTLIAAYLQEAMGYAAAGIKPTPERHNSNIPDALDQDAALAAAFAALTPGRQRGYYLHIGGAKQSSTRKARIAKCAPRIFAGKGFNER